jgi:hypothetical protein
MGCKEGVLCLMLDLYGDAHWRKPGQAYRPLTVEVGSWLHEAADAKCFSRPDSPPGSKAVTVGCRMLAMCCKPRQLPLPPPPQHVPSCVTLIR